MTKKKDSDKAKESFEKILHPPEEQDFDRESYEEMKFDNFPLASSIDNEILMHRDVHFGGQFTEMINYYMKEGKGIQPIIEVETIIKLQDMENASKENLAPVMLTGPEAEKVAKAKDVYKKLRSIYEHKTQKNKYPQLIADLILTENQDPQEEIQAIVKEGSEIVPYLIELLQSEEFYDPLFPGYGQAPALAAQCLGLIGDKRAIISLFEAIGNEDYFNEEIILHALKTIGQPAKEFLLKVLHGKPINLDNERAALALLGFIDDPVVSKTALTMLQDKDVRNDMVLMAYLVLACEGLQDEGLRKEFAALADEKAIPSLVRKDIATISKQWK
jgi:HEAT repeat protein